MKTIIFKRKLIASVFLSGCLVAGAFAAFRDRHAGTELIQTYFSGLMGKARPSAPAEVVLDAGESARVTATGAIVQKITPEELARRLRWAVGNGPAPGAWLAFQGQTLGEAIAEFNRHNKRQLVIENPTTGRIQIGGKFRANDVDAFVAALEATHRVRAKHLRADGSGREVIVLTGTGVLVESEERPTTPTP